MQLPEGLAFEVEPPYANALERITKLEDSELSYQNADLLHPAAIYNRATSPVVDAAASVLDELDDVHKTWHSDPDPDWGHVCEVLLEAQEDLLHALFEWIDVSYMVLVAASPKAAPKVGRFNYEWLKSVEPKVQQAYWNKIQPVHEDLGTLVNAMKHRGCHASRLVSSSPAHVTPGYYLQGLEGNVGMGPDPEIHPGATAFSFNRDLRLRLLQWLWLDDALDQAVAHIGRQHNLHEGNLTEDQWPHDDEWQDIYRRTSELGVEIFPDEREKTFPLVLYKGDGEPERVEAASRSNVGLPLGEHRFNFQAAGDGVTTHGRLPYPPAGRGEWDLDRTM